MHEEQQTKKKIFQKPEMQSLIGAVIVFASLGVFMFWNTTNHTVFIENSYINAPIINLSADTPGTLNAIYVSESQTVTTGTPLALVGTNIITAKESGIIVTVQNNIGEYFTPGEPVISMIHPDDMRVIGTIDENKGLDELAVGQKATFTVDAFPNNTYVGVVDEISQTADQTGVVFTISDKRPTNKFDVKVRFDISKYPELKNGMSAKITVFTK